MAVAKKTITSGTIATFSARLRRLAFSLVLHEIISLLTRRESKVKMAISASETADMVVTVVVVVVVTVVIKTLLLSFAVKNTGNTQPLP